MLNAVAIAALKKTYFANNALAGGTAKGDVLRLVEALMPVPLNMMSGPAMGKVIVLNMGERPDKVSQRALNVHRSAGVGQCVVTLHGETHTVNDHKGQPQPFMPDNARGNGLVQSFVAANENPELVLVERGFGNKFALGGLTSVKVREEDIVSPIVLGIAARSNFMAGFIFLCLAGGDQAASDRVLIFAGGEHADIMSGIEYFVQRSSAAWMTRRGRSYAEVRSLSH
jgi:hypothetical protein